MTKVFKIAESLIFIFAFFLISCGGGGGGGQSEFSPAKARLEVMPRVSEVGQEVQVTVSLSEVQSNLAVKLRVPAFYEYLFDSSNLEVNGETLDASPGENVTEDFTVPTDEDETPTPTATPTETPTPNGTPKKGGSISYNRRYLVYYLNKELFGEGNKGILTFTLVPKNILNKGFVEIDVDVDDAEIDNSDEFSLETPLFEAEDLVDVYIQN